MESMVAALQEIIDRNRVSLSIFLQKRFGITEEPTPLLLLALHNNHGDAFLEDLSIVLEKERLDNFGPDSSTDSTTDSSTKVTFFSKLKGLFDKAKPLISAVTGSKSSSSNQTKSVLDEKPKESSTKKIIIIGAIVIVVLIVVVVIIKRFKK